MNKNHFELDCIMDLIELQSKNISPKSKGFRQVDHGNYIKTKVHLKNNNEFGKPQGVYITYDVKNDEKVNALVCDIKNEIKKLIGGAKRVLVVGIGNDVLLSDSLGPRVVSNLQIKEGSEIELYKICPNVASNTGIDSFDLIKSVISIVKPQKIIAIDSLASRNFSRVGSSFQLSDAGIVPGSGCGKRQQFVLNKESLGVPVIAIGVPMVVHIKSCLFELLSSIKMEQLNLLNILSSDKLNALNGVILTPKEIDLMLEFCSGVLANALNAVI